MLKTYIQTPGGNTKHHFYDGAFLIADHHHSAHKRLKQIKQRRYLFEETNQKRNKERR